MVPYEGEGVDEDVGSNNEDLTSPDANNFKETSGIFWMHE